METPVLLLAYNRPDQTDKVLKRLVECGVSQLYVSLDGPKNNADKNKTDEVKDILNRFDSVIVKTNEATNNLGCKNAVIEGINWFFNQVEEGIILEDDCLPSEAFFDFTIELLARYQDNHRISMISGNNPLGKWETDANYFFSRIGHVWGWATWKNRWEKFNPELPDLEGYVLKSGFNRAFGPTNLAKAREEMTSKSLAGEIDTWDYQWNAHMLMSNGMAAIPGCNLIENIGFGDDATHTSQMPEWISTEVSEQLDVGQKSMVEPNREYEMELFLAQKSNSKANNSSAFFRHLSHGNNEKLNIVSINSTDIGGGAEKIALSIHQQLQTFGHNSHLLVATKKSDSSSILTIEEDWKGQIMTLKPDVIHVHNIHGTSIHLEGLLTLSKHFKMLFTLHDSWLTTGNTTHPFEPNPIGFSLLDLKVYKANFLARQKSISRSNIRWTAPSQWLRELFSFKHGRKPFFVPNGMYQTTESETTLPSKRYILFVANKPASNPYKDFTTLKTAWKNANEILGKAGCDLVCVGTEDNRSESHGSFRLHFISRKNTDEITFLLKQSLVAVQASRQDNAPLSILEAHLSNKLVVGAMVGGIPEMLSETEQDLLYEAGNVDMLRDNLLTAISQADSKRKQDMLPAVASVKEVTDTYLGHYHDLLNA